MKTLLSNYSYLWDGSEKGWGLLVEKETDGSIIFNRNTNVALIVEDEALKNSISQKMIDNGAEYITEINQLDIMVSDMDANVK